MRRWDVCFISTVQYVKSPAVIVVAGKQCVAAATHLHHAAFNTLHKYVTVP